MTVAKQLAERIHALQAADLPAEAIHWAKIGIVDTVAVTLAGAREDCTRLTANLPGVADAAGPALLFGTGRRTSILDAVLINGVASHALDFDDVNNQIGGHPSVPLVPALFALADMLGEGGDAVTGNDAIAAYVAGFEVETQLGLAVHFHHYVKGWHPTATLGIFGTVGVGARLLGLDVEKTAQALSLATSLSSGLKANFGTMTKPLHIGHSLRNGMMAVLLARDGFTANAAAFEHQQGFFEVFNGAGTYDAERIFDTWGAPWNVADPGPSLKAYPCCGSTHGAIDCALEIQRRHRLTPTDIQSIDIRTDPKRLPHTNNPDPATGLAAKFSVQYVVARAFVDAAVRLDHFESAAHEDLEVRSLMTKITIGSHPEMDHPDTDTYAAEILVSTVAGDRFSYRSGDTVLRGPGRPMNDDELFGKFADCSQRSLPTNAQRPLFELLMGLEAVPDLAKLTVQMESEARSPSAAAE